MKKIFMLAAAVVATAQCCAIDLSKENWKVPNWMTIVTEQGAIQEQYGKTKKWCGHVQGMCTSSNAIYFSFHDQIVKTDWYGRLLVRTPTDPHGGDICIWNDRLYTGVWLPRNKATGEKACGAIYMYDAGTLELLKIQKVKSKDAGVDGITCLDGVIYLAMGATGKYDPVTKSGRKCWYCKFKAETLEQIGEPFSEDHGDDSDCGSQNMTTDGKYIYSSHYTYDEAARTPNVVVHDKDTFKVVAKYRFGWNHGIDVVPGGKDGAVRFAWVFTPNWVGRMCKKQKLPLYGIVQFVELKDGQVFDFTEHGGGYSKEIER
jgi:glutaredoxin